MTDGSEVKRCYIKDMEETGLQKEEAQDQRN